MFKYLKLVAALSFVMIAVMPAAPTASAKNAASTTAEQSEKVAFNTKTRKYHALSCRWARKCTKSCIVIPRSEAIKRGGVPCKVCGGG